MTKDKIDRMMHLRRVYDTPDGREEILYLLSDYVFSTINLDDEESLIRRNDALRLLCELGVLTDNNLVKIVDNLMDMDYMIKED